MINIDLDLLLSRASTSVSVRNRDNYYKETCDNSMIIHHK